MQVSPCTAKTIKESVECLTRQRAWQSPDRNLFFSPPRAHDIFDKSQVLIFQ